MVKCEAEVEVVFRSAGFVYALRFVMTVHSGHGRKMTLEGRQGGAQIVARRRCILMLASGECPELKQPSLLAVEQVSTVLERVLFFKLTVRGAFFLVCYVL